MTAPDVLERTRMALAEAGHPNALVYWEGPSLCIDGTIPFCDAWRAMEIAWGPEPSHRPCCAKCSELASELGADGIDTYRSCAADRPLMADCGVHR